MRRKDWCELRVTVLASDPKLEWERRKFPITMDIGTRSVLLKREFW